MNERFIKTDLELLAIPGLSSRLRELYGRLRLHAGKDGKCNPKHSTLAKEIGLRSPRHVRRLLERLRELKLIRWTRGRYSNGYQVLDPDKTFLSHVIGQKSPISDGTEKSYRKDNTRKRGSKRRAAASSASGVENNNNNTHRGFSAEADVVVDGSPNRKPRRKPGALPQGWSREQVQRLEHAIGATLTRSGLDRVTVGPEAAIQLIRKSSGATEAEIHEVLRHHAERTSFRRAENPVGMLIHLVEQAFGEAQSKVTKEKTNHEQRT